MSSIRSVYLLSTNADKLHEYVHNFDRYGVRVVRKDPSEFEDDVAKIEVLQNPLIICLIKDQMELYQKGKPGVYAKLTHLELVESLSELTIWQLNKEKNGLVVKKYKNSQNGFLDMTRKRPKLLSVFGWDDIFINMATGRSNLEQKELGGIKITSRDMAISEYIRDRFYYSKRRDLTFKPQHIEKTIDFRRSVLDYFESHELYNNEWTRKLKVTNIWKTVAAEGLVFKSAKNRREGNYFSTLLNPALPLVCKRDPVHETTFQVHDCGHFMLLELIYTGYETSDLQKHTYTAFRMISEAVTMMMADILFIHAIEKGGVEYDFASRKIYPLYTSSNLDFERDGILPTLEKLIRANVDLALKGDDTKFRSIASKEALSTFKDKFVPFFVEDYKWNNSNYINMQNRKAQIRVWWDKVKHVREYVPNIRMLTIDEFIVLMGEFTDKERLDADQIVDAVFEVVWNLMIKPVFEKDDIQIPSEETRLYNTFVRYMMGQMAIFGTFSDVPETDIYQQGLLNLLKNKSFTKRMSHDEVEHAIEFFSSYVDILAQKNLITLDDAATYKEVYPMFEPCYVFYDEKKSFYDTLANVYKRQYGIPHRVIIAGPPGSGKGTQAKMLAEKYGIIHISTGDLVRQEVAKQTELGKRCEEIMNTGQLLPDDLINPIFLKRINEHDCRSRGWLLDGYPRTVSNLDYFRQNKLAPTAVLILDVDDETAILRQVGRVTDPVTGEIYHTSLIPPSSEIQHRLVKRSTDNEEKAKIRLNIYKKEMADFDTWFCQEVTHKIDANKIPQEVFHQICHILQ